MFTKGISLHIHNTGDGVRCVSSPPRRCHFAFFAVRGILAMRAENTWEVPVGSPWWTLASTLAFHALPTRLVQSFMFGPSGAREPAVCARAPRAHLTWAADRLSTQTDLPDQRTSLCAWQLCFSYAKRPITRHIRFQNNRHFCHPQLSWTQQPSFGRRINAEWNRPRKWQNKHRFIGESFSPLLNRWRLNVCN